VDISVVVCTHNRASRLRDALNHLLAQDAGGLQCELIVIDNNSTDGTAEVVRELARDGPIEVRYSFEPKQGISYARNTGWALARAPLIAYTDDDICVGDDWLVRVADAFARHNDVECVGGKVLPIWPMPPPAWLTRDHWSPLAILDYGDVPLRFDHRDPRCVVGANFAWRRDALVGLGGFSTDVQRVKDGIGSIEDHECLVRLWDAGGCALYVPDIVVHGPVDAPRLTKAYHRRWHRGHGHFHALMPIARLERSAAGRFLGVPACLYRQFLTHFGAWLYRIVSGRPDDAFVYETRMWFFWGFFQTRRRDWLRRVIGRLWRSGVDDPTRVHERPSTGTV
jgi:glycosyltransferase involved in cell wall biosynthesis